MIIQALEITLVGMGFVFGYLIILIVALTLLKKVGTTTDLSKVAAAIAFAKKEGKNG